MHVFDLEHFVLLMQRLMVSQTVQQFLRRDFADNSERAILLKVQIARYARHLRLRLGFTQPLVCLHPESGLTNFLVCLADSSV